ncbi:MAG: UTP--glucose-1-phosphate uridylyltransferase GalU [Patescibacteria group bacterium]
MSFKIRKAVIPVGGLGTRFLPVTKSMPKEMLPILDKPVIQYIVEEAVASGIEQIVMVTGRGKRAIEDHFDHSFELEHNLREQEKSELLERVQALENLAEFIYVRQPRPLGDGHAILCAKNVIGNEPFAVLFGDDLIDGPKPALKQLMEVYEKENAPVICVEKVNGPEISNYGVIDPKNGDGPLIEVKGLVEKPSQDKAPSNWGIIGKYVCTPDIFEHLENAASGTKDGEIRLIDAFRRHLERQGKLFALEVEGKRYDTGHKWGLLEANLAFALKDPELKEKLLQTCRGLL